MMKKYLLVGIVAALVSAHNLDALDKRGERKLKAAIAANSATEVEKLLRRTGIITLENKKEFLDEAQELVEYYEDNTALWSNPKDAAYAVAGLGLGALSAYLLGTGGDKWIDESTGVPTGNASHSSTVFLVSGGSLLPVAVYLAMKGFRGAARKGYLENAEDIVQFIEEAKYEGTTP